MASEMKLEVGKCYKTRDGRKVGPMGMHPAGDCMRSKGLLRGGLWNFDGSSHYPDMEDSPTLIAEWPADDAPTGPVRTVTRKEIVPGVYGDVVVGDDHGIFIPDAMHTAAELRAAIATLTEIADALEVQG